MVVEGGGETDLKSRYTGVQVTLYGGGEPVAMNRTSSAGNGRGGTAYLGKDILGSVRSVTNETGQLEDRYEYDAFGKPYQGDLDNGMNLGYMGKPYDSNTGLYNYGYRDYKPEAARFTTIDPIRDGTNWFVYVNNDPVNYVDLWGLRPLTQKEQQLHAAATAASGTGAGPVDYDNINLEDRKPTHQEVRDAAEKTGMDTSGYADYHIQDIIDETTAMSLPGGDIYVPSDARSNQERLDSLTVHEIEHQAQYENLGDKTTFETLVQEGFQSVANQNDPQVPNPYTTPGYLEYAAQQVENKANILQANGWQPSTGGKNQ